MTRTVIFALAVALGGPSALTIAHAQAPQAASPQVSSPAQTSTTRLVRFAGVLTDAAGNPLSGPQSVTFMLFDQADGGTALWTETLTVTADDRGRYAVNLGSTTPLPQDAFRDERARWLGVTVENNAQPRVMLSAVPYALRAADAETLGGQPAADFVRARADGRLETSAGTITTASVEGSGVPGQLAKFSDPTTLSSSIISESATNRIGVGLPDPTGAGVVDSVFTIRNYDNNTGLALLNQSQARRFALNTLANGSFTFYDGVGGAWNQGIIQYNGNLGLGTSTPSTRIFAVGTSTAIVGNSTAARGLEGQSTSSYGVIGFSNSGAAILGQSTGTAPAGQFNGNVNITGTLTKGGGAFKIDHPLDPENKYLQHSFVESPDMMNVYNGNVTLDENGEAWVSLPEWFEALNRDFRYQLTAMGAPSPNLYVGAEVSANRFKIAGGVANGRVSWQITGIRQDAWANAHRIPIEGDKTDSERGTYLHPEAYGQPVAIIMPSGAADAVLGPKPAVATATSAPIPGATPSLRHVPER
jgi:hypothetical protein